MNDTKYCIDVEDVEAALERVKGVVHKTPVLTSSFMDEWSGRNLFFKCENLQRGMSFVV